MTSYIINGIVSVTSTYCCARVIKLKNPFEIALLMTVHNLFLQEMEVFVECLDKEVDEHEHYTKVLIQVVRLATVIGSIPAIFWLAKKMEISTPNTKTYLGMSLGAGVLSYASLNVLSSSSS
ncbi:MAG: hypothetical protein JSS10_04285 [Verrucomicrobia bacterium]|nr:hypothetical protein [Verrucomicrobiota bacterium]